MTHLTSQQLVDAIEGGLAPVHVSHLDACDACQREVARLRSVVADLGAGDVPEPSPLFWDHFRQRVRTATIAEPVPGAPGWHGILSPMTAAGLALAAMAIMFVMRTGPVVAPQVALGTAGVAGDEAVASGDDESLVFVARIAASLSSEDLQQAARPSADGADAALDQLSASQRAELVRLIKARMGSGE